MKQQIGIEVNDLPIEGSDRIWTRPHSRRMTCCAPNPMEKTLAVPHRPGFLPGRRLFRRGRGEESDEIIGEKQVLKGEFRISNRIGPWRKRLPVWKQLARVQGVRDSLLLQESPRVEFKEARDLSFAAELAYAAVVESMGASTGPALMGQDRRLRDRVEEAEPENGRS